MNSQTSNRLSEQAAFGCVPKSPRLAGTVSKQRRKPPFAVTAEIDDAAAGRGVACRPFQFGEARHHGSAQRAGEVMAPFAPVEAGLAHRPARMRQHVRCYLQALGQESLALGGQLDFLLFLPD